MPNIVSVKYKQTGESTKINEMGMHESINENIFFDSVKEWREGYFVEYLPPVISQSFATLSLVFMVDLSQNERLALTRKELEIWLKRYPVPMMIFAYDKKENPLLLNNDTTSLFAWINPDTNQIIQSWDSADQNRFLEKHPNKRDWLEIYHDVSYRTPEEVKMSADACVKQRQKENSSLKIVIFLWVVFIRTAWVAIQFLGPYWLAVATTIYALWKITKNGLLVFGYKKHSATEKEKLEKEEKMKHYYYHCERNPEAFEELKIENSKRDAEKETKKEFQSLKNKNGVSFKT